jgi:hypothetical protein
MLSRLNELEKLKLELFTNGMKLTSRAKQAINEGMNIPEEIRLAHDIKNQPLTLAEFASTSGIPLRLGLSDIWVNTPIPEFNPNFVNDTSYQLEFDGDQFTLISLMSEVRVHPVPVPLYHGSVNSRGIPYTNFTVTHVDRARTSPIDGCSFSCGFCDSSLTPYSTRDVEEIISSLNVAISDPVLPARHILISGGTPRKSDYVYELEVYQRVCESFKDFDVDIMMSPRPGLLDNLEEIHDFGVNAIYMNLELFNDELAKQIIPHKADISKKYYLELLAQAAPIFGKGNVRSLLLVGLEPMEDTLNGVQALAEIGCDPILSPFRPSPKTPLSYISPSTTEQLAEVWIKSKEIVSDYSGVEMGPRCSPCHHNTLTFP